jgi:hypothetical protein
MQAIVGDPKEVMRQNLTFLRSYAKRTIVDGDTELAPIEDVKETLMAELRAIGRSFALTDRDMAVLLFQGIFTPQRSTY